MVVCWLFMFGYSLVSRDYLYALISRVDSLQFMVDEAEVAFDELSGRFDECSASRSLLVAEVDQLGRDLEYERCQRGRLVKLLSSALVPPRFDGYVVRGVVYDAYDDMVPSVVSEIVDDDYFVFSDVDWLGMLRGLGASVESAGLKYKSEVFDCEDYAWFAYSLFRLGCARSGFKFSGCFGYARSRSHAFNVYRDSGGLWRVWEPQSGKVVGLLGETVEPYVVIRIQI